MNEFAIGYTTGVFDLFHIGHLNILKSAKSICDYLIVGVTTDELALNYKNKVPYIPFNERIEIVQSIKYVDMAVPQESMNKLIAWDKYKFNVVVVGDDWKGTEKWKRIEDKFFEIGVAVKYFPYTKNTSSTKLRELIDNEISRGN